MATQFSVPAAASQFSAASSHYFLFTTPSATPSHVVSPASSATATPQNSSPTSLLSGDPYPAPFGLQARQLRPPKSPLYMPAVLRPSDPPRRSQKPSSLTPPQSATGSPESPSGLKLFSRRSTADGTKYSLGKDPDREWSISELPEITKLPTRKHWKPDSEATVCDETSCTRAFTYFTRRHHCRRCGNIFCDAHSTYVIPLDQDANYHPRGRISRACEFCFSEYKGWELARLSRLNSESSGGQPETPVATSSMSCGGKAMSAMAGVFGPKMDGTPESLGQSVPRDWIWSTF